MKGNTYINSADTKLETKVHKATKWSFITELMAKMIVPVTNMILARLLAPEAFGVVATINMIISFTDMFTEAGFSQYLIQHDFKQDKDFVNASSVAFWTNLSISCFLWLILIMFCRPVASFVGSSGYESAIIIACASLPMTSLSSIATAILQRNLDYKSLFFGRIASSLSSLFVTCVLALLGLSYWALIIGTLCSNLVKATVLWVRSKWHPEKHFRIEELKDMFNYGFWILLESIAMWLCTWIDIFIISGCLGAHYTGLYKTAQNTVTGILSVVTASVNSILFSTLSRYQCDNKKFKDTLYSFQKLLAIIVVPLGIGIFVFRDFITLILLGAKWLEAANFIGTWGICMSLVAVMGTFCREALRAKGMSKVSLFAQVIHLLFVIPVCAVSVKKGFDNLTLCRSLAYLQVIPVLFIFLYYKLEISPWPIISNTLFPLIAAIIMGLVGTYFRTLSDNFFLQFVMIIFCAFLYFIILATNQKYRSLIKNFLLQTIKH